MPSSLTGRVLLVVIISCFLSGYALAQSQNQTENGLIKGTVVDSASAAPLDFVTVGVRESGKTDLLKGAVTRENGSFEFKDLPLKKFEIVVSYVGYATKILPVPALTSSSPVADMGKISLSSVSNQLNEVQIVTEKLLIKQDIDKITYDVEADPESKTMNALDMLRKVPLITVDAEDNIQLKGSSNYRVLVNGKSSSLFVNNPKDVFKSMPASSIKDIEVITNPPSKYEAEGVGGIINIITHKKGPSGYNGSVHLGGGLPQSYNAGGYFTAKTGKFGASFHGGTNRYMSPATRNNLYREDYLFHNELNQQGTNLNNGQFYYLNGELSFEMDSLNLFSANVNTYGSRNNSSLEQQVRTSTKEGELVQAYDRLNSGKSHWGNIDVGADYQKSFRKNKDQLLTFSYKYGNSGNNSYTDFTLSPVFNYNGAMNTTYNIGQSVEQTFQADYVQPIKKHTLELGVKSILRDNNSDYNYSTYSEKMGSYVVDPRMSNSFSYSQDVYAAYTSFSLRMTKWGFKAGARMEETKINADFKSSGTIAKQDYFNLIPSVTLSRKFKQNNSAKISYTQRIERPGLWFLNPYVYASDPKNISYGNPALDAAISNNFDLSYSSFLKGASVNSSLYYNFTNNSIQRYTTLGADSVSRSTYANIGKNKTVGMSLSGNVPVTKKLNINLNTSANYTYITSNLNKKPTDNNGFTAHGYGNLSYRFGKNWRVNGNIGFNTGRILIQGRAAGFMFNSFSINKQFLKDEKASISLSVSNPFQKERRSFTEINDPNFYQHQESFYWTRRVHISFNYRFGKLKGGIAKKKRGINNDDVKGGGDSGGSGN
jgi:outer membrane receptor protein involved in Fe transport